MKVEVTSGFLVVKTFERMYREYLSSYKDWWQVKFPNADPIPQRQMPSKYRGISRDPIQPWVEALRDSGVVEPTERELAASLFMDELTKSEKAEDDFIFALRDANKLLEMISPPIEREIIWARRIDGNDPPPAGTVILGYEPTLFYPNYHSSIIADNAFFVYQRSHDDDSKKKMRLRSCHAKLNTWGLFNKPHEAEQYMEHFLQLLSGQESEVYYISEIRAIKQ